MLPHLGIAPSSESGMVRSKETKRGTRRVAWRPGFRTRCRPELERFRPQDILGAVPQAQYDDGLPADLEENAVEVPAFAVKELA